jgi:DeoR family transcriptional regulator, suf operon transcriptional repressor
MISAVPPADSSWNPPAGFTGVRGRILAELKRASTLTTKELAARLGVSLNAVRHHLRELEDTGLVASQRQPRGVGAPSFSYRLSSAGEALFPRSYESLLLGLLHTVQREHGREEAIAMLEAQFIELAERIGPELSGSSPEERLRGVARLLSDQGYMAEASSDTLVEHNCAVQAVAARFPEICAAEARFLSAVLQADVRRERHILNGCTSCEYRVRPIAGAVSLEGSA